jgi:hypothetical protein
MKFNIAEMKTPLLLKMKAHLHTAEMKAHLASKEIFSEI